MWLLLFAALASAAPAEPLRPAEIQNLAREAKRDLRLFAKQHARLWNLLETPLEMRSSCRDPQGNETDSGYGEKICLSATRLAERLEKKEAYPEIASLLLYELFHLAGYSETEAKNARDGFRLSLEGATEDTSYEKLFYLRDEAAALLAGPLEPNAVEAHQKKSHELGVFDELEWDYAQFIQVRTQLLHLFQHQRNEYEALFAGEKSATLKKIRERLGLAPKPNAFGETEIRKITGDSERNGLDAYFAQEAAYLNQLAFNGHLPKPLLPSADPWLEFAGRYRIVKRECENSRSFAGVSSVRIEAGRLIQDSGDSMMSLQDWTFSPAGNLITTQGAAGRAERLESYGNSWDRLRYRNRLVLQRDAAGLVLEEESESHYSETAEYRYHCQFRLAPIPNSKQPVL